MIRRTLLLLALVGGAYAACDAHASPDECVRTLSRAEAEIVSAQARYHANPSPQSLAWVAAAVEQLRTARALCDVREPVSVEAPYCDPFETTDDTDAAWVMTSQVAEDFAPKLQP
jgi:hypothetical protein